MRTTHPSLGQLYNPKPLFFYLARGRHTYTHAHIFIEFHVIKTKVGIMWKAHIMSHQKLYSIGLELIQTTGIGLPRSGPQKLRELVATPTHPVQCLPMHWINRVCPWAITTLKESPCFPLFIDFNLWNHSDPMGKSDAVCWAVWTTAHGWSCAFERLSN